MTYNIHVYTRNTNMQGRFQRLSLSECTCVIGIYHKNPICKELEPGKLWNMGLPLRARYLNLKISYNGSILIPQTTKKKKKIENPTITWQIHLPLCFLCFANNFQTFLNLYHWDLGLLLLKRGLYFVFMAMHLYTLRVLHNLHFANGIVHPICTFQIWPITKWFSPI